MAREKLFPAGSRALVMVSGGQDSRALLDLLAGLAGHPAAPESLHVLHVNHHLRGAESDHDEALTARACADAGIAVTVVHRSVAKRAGNIQEKAREARREVALQLAAEQGYDRIALGHTADDQVETMLYRLGRYGGLASLRGMLPCDPPWVRPLLECRRAETAAYCRARGLDFAEDRGNAYPGYARTAIREEVVPALEGALPGAVEAAGRAAQVAAEIEALVEALVAGAERDVARGDASILGVSGLLGLEPSLRRLLLHHWLERRARPAASRASVLALEAVLTVPGSAERSLAGGWRGVKEYDELRLERGCRRPEAPAAPAVPLSVPGRVQWGGVWVSAAPVDRYRAPDVSCEAYVDARSVRGALVVRGPQPGDRVQPLGMCGSRKLQDVLVDLHVPAAARPRTPLVVCDGRVVWVCGLLLAEGGRITGETAQIVRLEVSRGPGGQTADETAGREGGGTGGSAAGCEGDGQT
jgi:tRNA(Ile)-lysidine synthase